jgi:GT2 family glycosyltransferase
VRNIEVLAALAEGLWTYEPAGLLDIGHMRMFTRRSAEEMLDRAGLIWVRQIAVPGPGFDAWVEAGKPGRVNAGRAEIRDLSEQDAQDCYIYQWQFVCKRREAVDYGLTSIVIPVWNGLQDTIACLHSLRTHTPEAHEIIVIDNGSTDGTAEWLAAQTDIIVGRNEDNLGFPRACNQGMELATGDQVLLLNNDVILTPGWLRRMIEALREPGIGMVGPRSNNVSGAQVMQQFYRNVVELPAWAWDWSMRRIGERQPIGRLVGFCLLIGREVIEKVGLLDEQFGIGCYEDDDYCRRVEAAGYRLVIANDAFVHHHGSRTFVREGVDYTALMAQNAEAYRQKWSG